MGSSTRTGGRAATRGVIPGKYALSVGKPDQVPPAGWTWTALADIARLETGHTPSRKHPEYWGGDVPWIGIKDATGNHGRTLSDTLQHTNQLGLDNSSARLLPENTVCLSRTASVGYVVVMGRPMATSQDFVNWVCGPKIDHHFLKYVLLSEHDTMLSFASGTTHQTIYFPEVKAFNVCLPPLKEQHAIASILGALDDKIENNRRTNETLEAMARAIFKSWFVDFDPVHAKAAGKRPAGMDDATAALFPSEFEDSELGPIPKGWATGSLTDIAKQRRDSVQVQDIKAGEHYIGLEHMPRRSIALSAWGDGASVTSNKSRFNKGDFLFGKLRPYFHKVGVAPVDGVCSTDIVVVQPIEPEWYGPTLATITSDSFIDEVAAASTGTKMPRTNWRDMSKFRIALPPKPIAHRYTSTITSKVAAIHCNIDASISLAATRDALLPKLLSGELRIPDAERAVEEVA